jgi:hypothetical protein
VLAAQRIPRPDIGVLGWTYASVDGVDRELYVPLRITQHRPVAATSGYDLVLYPTVELKEVYLTVTALGADGRPAKTLQRGKPLKHRFYPAEEPVVTRLTGLEEPGVYLVEIGAALAGGGSSSLAFRIVHAPETPAR